MANGIQVKQQNKENAFKTEIDLKHSILEQAILDSNHIGRVKSKSTAHQI